MEFKYNSYLITITPNPNDLIVRFEHEQSHRLYERIFTEEDFPTVSSLGGLVFVENLLSFAFQPLEKKDVNLLQFSANTQQVSFDLKFQHPFMPNAIQLPFEIPAMKSDSNAEMDSVQRKIRDLNLVVNTLVTNIKALEERCGDTITLPGCIFAIPTNVTTLVLIRNETSLPDGSAYSSAFPGYRTTGHYNSGHNEVYPISWSQVLRIPYAGRAYHQWVPSSNVFTFDKLTSIKNLKYLKQCTSLILSGCSELSDYSAIGEMTQLTHLSIISSRVAKAGNNPVEYIQAGNHPGLTDLSWIQGCKNLQSLTLMGCKYLTLSGFNAVTNKNLPSLYELDIRETGIPSTTNLALYFADNKRCLR